MIAFVPGVRNEFLLVRGETLGQRSTWRAGYGRTGTSRTSSPPFRSSVVVSIFGLADTSGPKAIPKVLADGSRRRCAATDATRNIPPDAVTASNRAPTSTYASAGIPSVSEYQTSLPF